MRPQISEEMISAYIDNELDRADRELVELALSESAELRELHSELIELGKTFSGLPRHTLPADFQDRVLRRASRRSAEVTLGTAVQPAAGVGSRGGIRRWTAPLIVGTTVAAVLLAVFVMNWRDGSVDPVNPFDGQTSFVYYQRENRPQLCLVIDVTVTPQGRSKRAVEAVFAGAGIDFDPDLMVAEELEESILKSRMLANVQQFNKRDEEAQDDVRMTYVVAESDKIDAIYFQMRARQQDFSSPQLDLLRSKHFDLMHRLNETSRLKFADRDSATKRSLAHRLLLRVSLKSTGGLARIPTVRLEAADNVSAEEVPAFGPRRVPPARHDAANAKLGQDAAAAPAPNAQVSEVLFVLRYMNDPAGRITE